MELINNLKKYLTIKRPTISIISSKTCDFILIKHALSINKTLCIKTFTYKFEEADLIIINGFFTTFQLSELDKINNSLKQNCRVILCGYTNAKIYREDLIIAKCNENIDTLAQVILKVLG